VKAEIVVGVDGKSRWRHESYVRVLLLVMIMVLTRPDASNPEIFILAGGVKLLYRMPRNEMDERGHVMIKKNLFIYRSLDRFTHCMGLPYSKLVRKNRRKQTEVPEFIFKEGAIKLY
jgi:hypothetical protein